MIEIMNQTHCKPTEPYDVIVDRRGILGNPFFLFDEDDRDKVCDLYAKRFEVVKNEPAYKEKLEELLSILKNTERYACSAGVPPNGVMQRL